jgi:hypothetical protein
MLATIAALHLLALSQVAPPPREVTPTEPDVEESAPAPVAGAENPPLPRRGEVGAPPSDASAPRDAPPASAAIERRRRPLSLLSAEPLGGGSTALAWAGWSSLGIMYGQGITARDDLAGFLDFDWATSELKLGALYRRPLGVAGPFDMAGRLSAAWYLNFGSDYIHDENHSDNGVEVVPGLVFSRSAAGGVFSALAEAPITVTTKYGAGLLFAPRFSLAFEGPLYPELTVGARIGAGYRAGSGDAPLSDGRAELMFLVLAGYQIL